MLSPVFIAAIVLMVTGFLLYLGAFSQGPGPSMADKPIQAWMFFGATACMVTGFLLLVV
jgi:hypothetical protein